MKRLLWATTLYFIGYFIATVVGFATFFISETVMWLSVFILMPVVFGVLAYSYLEKTRCDSGDARREMFRLIAFWIALSFALDAVTYVGIVPAITGLAPDWHFFQEQSPWIWLSYLVLSLSGYAAVTLFLNLQLIDDH